MKSFIDVCRMSAEEVKKYMHKYLSSYRYTVENEDGFLYAAGDAPVLLVAHTDTVHKEPVKEVRKEGNKISSPQGIGGDDRCGIYMIMNIIKELHCSVLLCDDEERGGIGANKFVKSEASKNVDVKYIIELDRRGNKDLVFYSCGNEKFTDFVCDYTGFREAYGTYSDISTIAPALGIAAVNISCGYYEPHTTNEYVNYDEMMDIVETVKHLIQTDCESFKYIKKKYDSYNWGDYTPNYSNYSKTGNTTYGQRYGQLTLFQNSRIKEIRSNQTVLLDVTFVDEVGEEDYGYGEGNTKAEAWVDFFTKFTNVCVDMITDYTFS